MHSLDQYLHACKENNFYLKEKVKVLEQNSKQSKRWYEGQPAHALYKKQAFVAPKAPQLVKKRYHYTHKGKYGITLDRFVCTYCGNNRHTHHNYPKRLAYDANYSRNHVNHGQSSHNQQYVEATHFQGDTGRPQKKKMRQSQAVRILKNKGPKQDVIIAPSHSSKPKKFWVVKS